MSKKRSRKIIDTKTNIIYENRRIVSETFNINYTDCKPIRLIYMSNKIIAIYDNEINICTLDENLII